MEFRTSNTEDPTSPVDGLRMNWFYRPRDVQRFTIDTRLTFATMHSDICPLSSLRGKCYISHKSEFGDLDEYKKSPDHFYFTQVFDRFMHKWFEVIPTVQVVNVPENVKKALDLRWKYIVVEASKVKELTSDAKRCKRCVGYCASNDSVECAVCHLSYHMSCVKPPLLKKPSRGFAWACGPCSRAQERKLEARRTPQVGVDNAEVEEDEVIEEEEEEVPAPTTSAATPEATDDRPATDAEVAHAKMWTMRYLGVHCRVEDALQYDDRAIFPRAGSRLGPKHQANTSLWYGRPVKLVKPVEIKKRFIRAPGKKEATKLSKETLAAMEADRAAKATRPQWIEDEPAGYLHRGEDIPNKDKANTATLIFKLPQPGELSERGSGEPMTNPEQVTDAYMKRAKLVAKQLGVADYSVDFLDRALYCLHECNFDADLAIKHLKKTDPVGKWPENKNQIRKDLRDPALTFTAEDKKRFEEGVALYGSELRGVRAMVKTQPHADIVRYWYHWKKTAKGKEIWGSFGGRKNTKKLKAETEAAAKLLDDIAHDQDDSAFDNEKIEKRARKMICKHCSVRHSRIWRRAPGVSPGQTTPGEGRASKKENLLLALCDRCARLWRKYAIKWENMDEIMKKLTQVGSKAWKKKFDPELLREIEIFHDKGNQPSPPALTPEPQIHIQVSTEPPKKKARQSLADTASNEAPPKKKVAAPPPPPPPPAPLPPLEVEMPKMKSFSCFVCDSDDNTEDQLLKCRDCQLTVHRKCYGLGGDARTILKWSCDMCLNDRKEQNLTAAPTIESASHSYSCLLCPTHQSLRELVTMPKVSLKKKKDEREKVKEQKELDLVAKMIEAYQTQKIDAGRPPLPREALKKTADSNWAHVVCSIFTPEIKFSNAKTLDVAEGVPFAIRHRSELKCHLCNRDNGAPITCHASGCQKSMHVSCAGPTHFKCLIGFDVTPVKGSRHNDAVVTLGKETGKLTPVVWCKEHAPHVKSIVHPLSEKVVGSELTAIEFYAQHYKQADETVTGTTRKANQLDEYTKLAMVADQRRTSTSATIKTRAVKEASSEAVVEKVHQCATCNVRSSPKWYQIPSPELSLEVKAVSRAPEQRDFTMTNGHKADSIPSRESSMRVETLLSNGDVPSFQHNRATSHSVADRVPIPLEGSSEVIEIRKECHKCHYRRLHPPPAEDPMDIEETIESPMMSPINVMAHHLEPAPQNWGSLSSIPPQAPSHAPWPPPGPFAGPQQLPPNTVPFGHQRLPYGQAEGTGFHHHDGPNYAHPRGAAYPPNDAPYHGPEVYAQHPSNAPTIAAPHGYPQQHGHPPHILPGPPPGPPGPDNYHHPQQGYHHPPQHAGPPMHGMGPNGLHPLSPSRTMSNHLPRHSQSPYQASRQHPPPLSAQSHTHGYAHHHHHQSPASHHGSPVLALDPALSPSLHMPSGPSMQPLLHARPSPHGASASASVRNLIE